MKKPLLGARVLVRWIERDGRKKKYGPVLECLLQEVSPSRVYFRFNKAELLFPIWKHRSEFKIVEVLP